MAGLALTVLEVSSTLRIDSIYLITDWRLKQIVFPCLIISISITQHKIPFNLLQLHQITKVQAQGLDIPVHTCDQKSCIMSQCLNAYVHSLAVLKNNALFILFGIDNTKLATNDFHVLNTQTYQWMTSYSAGSNDANSANNPNGANGANNSGTNPINDGANNAAQAKDGGTGLSSGAIAGICVGVIGAVSI
jgi:hypothetical protein